jgi:hypothetical protein
MMRLLGGIMVAAGILIAGASGLCSMFAMIMMLSESNGSIGSFFGAMLLVLIVGGIPFGAGLGLFYGGRNLIRRDAEPPYDRDVF